MRTRFAPSPTGLLHLGHAFSALTAFDLARQGGGKFLLRIEDLDPVRCQDRFVQAIFDDLSWLGLSWPQPVRRQSQHLADFTAAMDRLDAMGLLYPCFCSRADIAAATQAPHGPDGALYPGTCKGLDRGVATERLAAGAPCALRLDMDRAVRMAGPLSWTDDIQGPQPARPTLFGDVVLARKEVRASYHLAVVVDDALQAITLVVRGQDLFSATHVHRLLQALLDLPVPLYHHHRLILGADGKRLAKRDGAAGLGTLRTAGYDRDYVRKLVGLG